MPPADRLGSMLLWPGASGAAFTSTDRAGNPVGRYAAHGVPEAILAYSGIRDLELWSYASAEAQVAAIADDIAYDAHDIDDGLRADLFTLADLATVPLIGEIIAEVDARYPGLAAERRAHECVRRIITRITQPWRYMRG